MFFEKDSLSFNLLDVLELRQKNISIFNSGRNFSALSFRYRANTALKTENEEYRLKDNFVSYVPARLDYERVATVDELIVVHFETMDYRTKSIECFEARRPEILARLFSDILECWNKKEVGYKYRCSAILCEIFAECYADNYKATSHTSKIQNSVDYIHKNYRNQNLTLKEIAAESFMSEVYFRKLFKEQYKVSPQKYIIDLRIQNAVGLISTGYYSLKEVAYMSGYNDYKYFSTEFKRIKGVSPSEYLYNYHE